jgi:hypothetical protein
VDGRLNQFRVLELTCGALGTDQNLAPHIKRQESQGNTQLSVMREHPSGIKLEMRIIASQSLKLNAITFQLYHFNFNLTFLKFIHFRVAMHCNYSYCVEPNRLSKDLFRNKSFALRGT